MKISGLQKTTLIDYPGEVACTLFLYGCNFRCGFCHNPEIVIRDFEEGFSEENILNFLKERKGKLDAVCITGGEPLMSLDLDFVKKIKEIGYKIKVDTNGSFPNRLKEMVDLGLVDYVAMDIKAAKKNYSKVVNVVVIPHQVNSVRSRTLLYLVIVGSLKVAKILKCLSSSLNKKRSSYHPNSSIMDESSIINIL